MSGRGGRKPCGGRHAAPAPARPLTWMWSPTSKRHGVPGTHRRHDLGGRMERHPYLPPNTLPLFLLRCFLFLFFVSVGEVEPRPGTSPRALIDRQCGFLPGQARRDYKNARPTPRQGLWSPPVAAGFRCRGSFRNSTGCPTVSRLIQTRSRSGGGLGLGFLGGGGGGWGGCVVFFLGGGGGGFFLGGVFVLLLWEIGPTRSYEQTGVHAVFGTRPDFDRPIGEDPEITTLGDDSVPAGRRGCWQRAAAGSSGEVGSERLWAAARSTFLEVYAGENEKGRFRPRGELPAQPAAWATHRPSRRCASYGIPVRVGADRRRLPPLRGTRDRNSSPQRGVPGTDGG